MAKTSAFPGLCVCSNSTKIPSHAKSPVTRHFSTNHTQLYLSFTKPGRRREPNNLASVVKQKLGHGIPCNARLQAINILHRLRIGLHAECSRYSCSTTKPSRTLRTGDASHLDFFLRKFQPKYVHSLIILELDVSQRTSERTTFNDPSQGNRLLPAC